MELRGAVVKVCGGGEYNIGDVVEMSSGVEYSTCLVVERCGSGEYSTSVVVERCRGGEYTIGVVVETTLQVLLGGMVVDSRVQVWLWRGMVVESTLTGVVGRYGGGQ